MNIFGIIPARYDSSRFPGKPLADIQGKPMIRRVYEQSLKSKSFKEITVATDDARIIDCVKEFGGSVCLTSPLHRTGTERCNEAAGTLSGLMPDDIIFNIQGDEPFIDPGQLDQLAACFSDPTVQIATLAKKIATTDELFDPNVVKVIFDKNKKAILFSRQAIPFIRGKELHTWIASFPFFKHIGLYGYRASVLGKIVALPESKLELAESLEQLRWLDNGYSIHVEETSVDSISVDTPEDLLKFTNKS
jgi:3-deoxy-manno-octulosonate cytidylyltransferase (CMP-KDO synthetase)